eukprot:scaffold126570_cov81-Phaeocystis_antarctica.AAC.2
MDGRSATANSWLWAIPDRERYGLVYMRSKCRCGCTVRSHGVTGCLLTACTKLAVILKRL